MRCRLNSEFSLRWPVAKLVKLKDSPHSLNGCKYLTGSGVLAIAGVRYTGARVVIALGVERVDTVLHAEAPGRIALPRRRTNPARYPAHPVRPRTTAHSCSWRTSWPAWRCTAHSGATGWCRILQRSATQYLVSQPACHLLGETQPGLNAMNCSTSAASTGFSRATNFSSSA